MLCVNKEESVPFGTILEEEDDKTCAPWWSSEYFLVFVLSGTMSHFSNAISLAPMRYFA
jgi:hypothetical protein